MTDITSSLETSESPAAKEPRPRNLYEKRFTLPINETARKNLETFRGVYYKLEPENPEFIGMTLFGSMVKGKATEHSDFDAFLFVDYDQAKDKLTSEDWQRAQEMADEDAKKISKNLTRDQITDLATRNHYLDRVVAPLLKAGISPEQVEHIRVRVLSKQIILDELARGINYEQAITQYEQESDAYYAKEMKSPFDPNNGPQPERPEPYMMDWRISAMFHLAMGRDINAYRSIVLEFLMNKGEAGGKSWQSIIGRVSDMERNLNGEAYANLYPQNIQEAFDYFHIQPKSASETSSRPSTIGVTPTEIH